MTVYLLTIERRKREREGEGKRRREVEMFVCEGMMADVQCEDVSRGEHTQTHTQGYN